MPMLQRGRALAGRRLLGEEVTGGDLGPGGSVVDRGSGPYIPHNSHKLPLPLPQVCDCPRGARARATPLSLAPPLARRPPRRAGQRREPYRTQQCAAGGGGGPLSGDLALLILRLENEFTRERADATSNAMYHSGCLALLMSDGLAAAGAAGIYQQGLHLCGWA